jgi:hypothetical protein
MNLLEAMAAMMEGKTMIDARGIANRVQSVSGFKPDNPVVFPYEFNKCKWIPTLAFCKYGWREATPEELKEIGL